MNEILPPDYSSQVLPSKADNRPTVSPSRLAVYEAMIAFAWIDGPMHEDNQKRLVELFLDNRHLTEDQRQMLFDRLEIQTELKDIWPRITEPQDRAYLLDYAERIFGAGGNYSEAKRALHKEFLEKHLATLDVQKLDFELAANAAKLKEKEKIARRKSLGARNGLGYWDLSNE